MNENEEVINSNEGNLNSLDILNKMKNSQINLTNFEDYYFNMKDLIIQQFNIINNQNMKIDNIENKYDTSIVEIEDKINNLLLKIPSNNNVNKLLTTESNNNNNNESSILIQLKNIYNTIEEKEKNLERKINLKFSELVLENKYLKSSIQSILSVNDLKIYDDLIQNKINQLNQNLQSHFLTISHNFDDKYNNQLEKFNTWSNNFVDKSQTDTNIINAQIKEIHNDIRNIRERIERNKSDIEFLLNEFRIGTNTKFDEVDNENKKIVSSMKITNKNVDNQKILIDNINDEMKKMNEVILNNRQEINDVVKGLDGELQDHFKQLMEHDGSINDNKYEINNITNTLFSVDNRIVKVEEYKTANIETIKQIKYDIENLNAITDDIQSKILPKISEKINLNREEINLKYELISDNFSNSVNRIERNVNDIKHELKAINDSIDDKLQEMKSVVYSTNVKIESNNKLYDEKINNMNNKINLVEKTYSKQLIEVNEQIKQTEKKIDDNKKDHDISKSSLEAIIYEQIKSVNEKIVANEHLNEDKINIFQNNMDEIYRKNNVEAHIKFELLKSNLEQHIDGIKEDITITKQNPTSNLIVDPIEASESLKSLADILIDPCCEYEDLCFHELKLIDFPEYITKSISLQSQQVAELISNIVNSIVVNTFIQGNFENFQYTNNFIDKTREEYVHKFLQFLIDGISQLHPNAATQKIEARSRFKKKVSNTIYMTFTRLPSIQLIENSRISTQKLNVPLCIACDRPLIENNSLLNKFNTSNSDEINELESNNINNYNSYEINNNQTKLLNRPKTTEYNNNNNNNTTQVIYKGGFRMKKTKLLPSISSTLFTHNNTNNNNHEVNISLSTSNLNI